MSLLLLFDFIFRWVERRYGLLTVFLLYSVTLLPETLTVIRLSSSAFFFFFYLFCKLTAPSTSYFSITIVIPISNCVDL
jgi:hypothetical protein